MKRNRKIVVLTAVLLVFAAGAGWWLSYVPEPAFEGVGLGTYLERWQTNQFAANNAVRSLGSNAVPYLVQQMQRDLLTERLLKIGPKLPASIQPILPQRQAYEMRRYAAASLLMGQPDALPAALAILEQDEPSQMVMNVCVINVANQGPRSAHEERAVKALVKIACGSDRTVRHMALEALSNYRAWSSAVDLQTEIIPALIAGLYYPGGTRYFDPLIRLGTNALQALRVAAENEKTNVHIRPAGMVLEKIEQELERANQTVVTERRAGL